MGREREISELFVSLADTLVGEYEAIDLLQRLVDGAKSVLQADAVGVLLGGRPRQLGLSAASDEDMETLELFELQSETGPCYEAYISGDAITIEDVEAERARWPEFVPRALELGFRSGAAFPLRLRDDTIGALNVFRRSSEQLPEEGIRLGQALADMATVGILQARAVSDAELRAEQLHGALESRVIIEQAKGMLAGRLGVPPEEAFARMRDHSRNQNMKLREICRRVVDDGFVPD